MSEYFTRPKSDRNDFQDHVERGLWGEVTYVAGAGAHMTIRGTGTLDEEVTLWVGGYAFNLDANSNAEVMMLSLGGDVSNKIALPSIARDMQHPWAPGTGGIQHPTNPDRRIEFNGHEILLKDGTFVLGNNREVSLTINGGQITLSANGNLSLVADNVEITSTTLTHNGVNVGDNHIHSGVETGPSNTGAPV